MFVLKRFKFLGFKAILKNVVNSKKVINDAKKVACEMKNLTLIIKSDVKRFNKKKKKKKEKKQLSIKFLLTFVKALVGVAIQELGHIKVYA